jgi:hypothetical protein
MRRWEERAARLAGVGMAKPGRNIRWLAGVPELRPSTRSAGSMG